MGSAVDNPDPFELHHQTTAPAVRDSDWTKRCPTLRAAQAEADQYWPGPDSCVLQIITDLRTGEEWVRDLAGSWNPKRPQPLRRGYWEWA